MLTTCNLWKIVSSISLSAALSSVDDATASPPSSALKANEISGTLCHNYQMVSTLGQLSVENGWLNITGGSCARLMMRLAYLGLFAVT